MRASGTGREIRESRETAAPWSVDRWGRLIAGLGVLACTLLALLHDPRWLYGALFAGLNLIASALTDCCPVHNLLIRLGAREREDLFLPGGSLRRMSALPHKPATLSALISPAEIRDEVPARVARRSSRIERARMN
ncbi:MAG: DUF2892 domain-containing protein [Planctomycetes bacterium]|nr:DUF2892 domain-containing protein [Planctomycetota bacterium]